MNPGPYTLKVYRGDTYRWRFTLYQDTQQTLPVDLEGVTAASQIRDRPGGTLACTMTCSVELPNIVNVVLSAADCAKLPASAVWDLQLIYASGDVATVLAGPVNVTPDVTDTVPVPLTRRSAA